MNKKEFLLNLQDLANKNKKLNLFEALVDDPIEGSRSDALSKGGKGAGDRVANAVYDTTIGAYKKYWDDTLSGKNKSQREREREKELDSIYGSMDDRGNEILSRVKSGVLTPEQGTKQLKSLGQDIKDVGAEAAWDANLETGEQVAKAMTDTAATGLAFTAPGAAILLKGAQTGTEAAKATGYLDTFQSKEQSAQNAWNAGIETATLGAFRYGAPLLRATSKLPGVKQVGEKTADVVKAATPEFVKKGVVKAGEVADKVLTKADKIAPANAPGAALGAVVGAQTIDDNDTFLTGTAKLIGGSFLGSRAAGLATRLSPGLAREIAPLPGERFLDRTIGEPGRRKAADYITQNVILPVERQAQVGLASAALSMSPGTAGPVATSPLAGLRAQTASMVDDALVARSGGPKAAETAPVKAAETAPTVKTVKAAETAPVKAAETAPVKAAEVAQANQVNTVAPVAQTARQTENLRAQEVVTNPSTRPSRKPSEEAKPKEAKPKDGKGKGKGKAPPPPVTTGSEESKPNIGLTQQGTLLSGINKVDFGDVDTAIFQSTYADSAPSVSGNFYGANKKRSMTTENYKNRFKRLLSDMN